jgi:glycosyltransferase involved in cell wall biosynthesis
MILALDLLKEGEFWFSSGTFMRIRPTFIDKLGKIRSFDTLETDSFKAVSPVGTQIMFDISDLVYYIGHHSNLTGIQRVQSSIVLAILEYQIVPRQNLGFLSFDARARQWVSIGTGFLSNLLRDLVLPEQQRVVTFSADDAKYGVLPGARPFDGSGALDNGGGSVLCLLGAAWVQQDYFHRVLALKRRFGTRFVMTVHDMIPIYARETCDQDTARVFEEFMRRGLRHVDHILAVSENTAQDVRRYLSTLQLTSALPITVTRNGSSFAEFLPKNMQPGEMTTKDLPERFVLFVATIEGRKNHQFMLNIWRRMIERGDNPPHLICVGRLGWKSSNFISMLVETNYLGGRVHLLRDISDADLRLLYDRCLFTVCPTFYEGWGLPVGEALAQGKICVCSDRSSIPEVAGDCGVYIDIDDLEGSLATIRDLIGDAKKRDQLEAKIRREYRPITWQSVAEKVVAACRTVINTEWPEPYPYTVVPYSAEISFGHLDRNTDGMGEALLARILQVRRGHFLYGALDEESFRLGEEIRCGGTWAQPEEWGVWLCHDGGDLVLSLAEDDSQHYFVFLRARVSGALLIDRPIHVTANGESLWSGAVGGGHDIVLRIRKPLGGPGSAWRLRLTARVDLTPELRDQIARLDLRVPTIGFERLVVVPENDWKTRVDILTAAYTGWFPR